MGLYSEPPPAKSLSDTKPTLLVAWWITIFCTCLTLLRLAGRYIRIEKLFLEDKIAAASLLPLYLRIACVHVVLLYGTNNVQLDQGNVAAEELSRRATASRVVLAGRIFYAATLWTLKLTTLEFMNRLAGASMKKIYLRLITFLRYALGATFLAVIVSDLAECRPLPKYWQVLPDPGPQCRQGFAQLLTMGTSSAIIDSILVIFPVPIVMSTRIATKRKVLLVLLFCFGFLTVGITAYRMPNIIHHQGAQITRSMWASVELLAATTVANLVALGSFLRDSGAKKKRFRQDYGTSGATSSNRKPGQSSATGDREANKRGAHHDSLESDGWDSHGKSDDREDGLVENRNHLSPSVGARGASPTDSHDSLIRPSQRSSVADGVLGLTHPRPPSPIIPAGMKGLQHRR
ncbi:hypothetical protein QQS21_004190 [Conoideocrella luteorostrata]|uniref:Rhodopsin domain-containing protein n=1 Tax=Conoideocrella luteorostrata TaxID=1105319 RepID=A0AAJ0FUW2_9HYPO|nr:hypothetical protein QQS21_004190 [Conoideocrella luteorostrata]